MGLGRWRPSSRQTHRLPCDDCAIAIGRWMPFGLFRSALVGCQPPAWRGRVKGRCCGYALVPNRGWDNQSRPNPDLALNNPAAGCMPTAGPSCGGLSTGRSLHAVPGVKLPLAVILTAHRLRAPYARPGRRRQYQASTSKAKGFGSGRLVLSLRSPTVTTFADGG